MWTHFFASDDGSYLGGVPFEGAAPGPAFNVPEDAVAVAGDALPPGTPRDAVSHDRGGLVIADMTDHERVRREARPDVVLPLLDAVVFLTSELAAGGPLSAEAQAVAERLRRDFVPLAMRSNEDLDMAKKARERAAEGGVS